MKIAILITAILTTTLVAAPPTAPANIAQLEYIVKVREQRTTLLRDELKAQDERIEERIEALVEALRSITDSKDSRTKVTRLKQTTISALMKNLEYFRQKRAALIQELRRPTWRLTDEQKQKGIAAFDAHIEKRVSQILELQKSFPTHKDYDRYKVTGNDWYGTTYAVNEDYKQNQRLTSHTNSQTKELEEALRKSIARLDQQNRSLQAQGGPTEEIAKNEQLIADRKKQLASVLMPEPTPTRAVGSKEATNLDMALRKATEELRREFVSLFGRYNSLIAEFSALNSARDALAAASSR